MNRRELLTAFLGLPFLPLGCSFGTRPLPPRGTIVGASVVAGHALREGLKPQPTSDAWSDVNVLIVGGGISGLSAARRLTMRGVRDVTVLEIEPELGGTSRGGTSSLISFPWGAHYVPVPFVSNTDLVEFFRSMGVVEGEDADGEPLFSEEVLCRDPEERLFINGKWYEGLLPSEVLSDDDRRQLTEFQTEVGRWIAWRDASGRRAFTVPSDQCSSDPVVLALDQITMGEWLAQHGWNSKHLRWYVDYACRDDYGMTVDQTSAWAGLFYFAARVRTPGSESQPFVTWPEGNSHLAKVMATQAACPIETGWVVTQITPEPMASSGQETGTCRVIAMRTTGTQTEVRGWRAKHVIVATPPFLCPFLIDGYREQGPAGWREFQFGSWLVANLHLTQRPSESGFPLCWDNVLFEGHSLGYVAATHQRGLDFGPSVFTYYLPLCDDDPKVARERLLSLTWAECAELVLSDLERAHPTIRSQVEQLDVMRWGHAMIRPRPGFITGPARSACRSPFRGIHFAHASLSGLPLFEEAFQQGIRAADEVAHLAGS
jgi:hypothetical protein